MRTFFTVTLEKLLISQLRWNAHGDFESDALGVTGCGLREE